MTWQEKINRELSAKYPGVRIDWQQFGEMVKPMLIIPDGVEDEQSEIVELAKRAIKKHTGEDTTFYPDKAVTL